MWSMGKEHSPDQIAGEVPCDRHVGGFKDALQRFAFGFKSERDAELLVMVSKKRRAEVLDVFYLAEYGHAAR